MNEIKGMAEAFKEARVVYLTTFRDGEVRSRQMTNLNEDPYRMMWFPTYRDTRKVEDIGKNPRVLVTFPSLKEDEYYEIEGRAEFESESVTAEKWQWWYLYWHPAQRRRFWFPGGARDPNRVIVNVYPESARVVKEGEQQRD
ncbi:MAG: pyridoxamine 5'-phosphate oxidase family protein [Candidatus Bathyarchaeota archaeon]|jgi:general stress protein 26|nr:pyridoxamine 5'-phosphate oxidase family protein [Candidatus Bathyarchaeota archaeon]